MSTPRAPRPSPVLPLVLLLAAGACSYEHRGEPSRTSAGGEPQERITMSEQEWKQKLTPEQYRICREKGTERAFTGEYWNTKDPGTYRCVACGNPLFDSDTKFESGTGWPSFSAPVDDSSVETERDSSLGMVRVEVHCRRCASHLGHVFPDGPEPTGQRFCINSASLRLEKR